MNDLTIVSARKNGSSYPELARVFGKPESEVRNIVKSYENKPDTFNNNLNAIILGPMTKKSDTWTCPPVHPAALTSAMMSSAEIDELAADIDQKGLHDPIVIWEDNSEAANGATGPFPEFLLDGRNRIEALRRLGKTDLRDVSSETGISCKAIRRKKAVKEIGIASPNLDKITHKWVPDTNPEEFVITANVRRRHQTLEAKRETIARLIALKPQASNRQIAKLADASDHTVANVRDKTSENAQNAQNPSLSLPLERAKAAVRKNPKLSNVALAKVANVSDKTIAKARQELTAANEMTTTNKSEIKPEVEILRQVFKDFDVPMALFKKDMLRVCKLNVTETLFREYLNELEEIIK